MQQFKLNPVTNFCLSGSWHWKFMENSLENTAGMDETFSSPSGDALEEPQFPWRVNPLFFLLHRLVASMGPKVDPSGVLQILGTHPLFPKAQLCILNKFPDLQSKPGVSFTFIYFLGFFLTNSCSVPKPLGVFVDLEENPGALFLWILVHLESTTGSCFGCRNDPKNPTRSGLHCSSHSAFPWALTSTFFWEFKVFLRSIPINLGWINWDGMQIWDVSSLPNTS